MAAWGPWGTGSGGLLLLLLLCCLALAAAAAAAAAYLLLKSHSAYSVLPHCVVYTWLAVDLSKKLSSSTKRPDEYF